jgi:hypothetical protein
MLVVGILAGSIYANIAAIGWAFRCRNRAAGHELLRRLRRDPKWREIEALLDLKHMFYGDGEWR